MSSVHLAVDDTDSLDGMCTTYLATLLVEEFSDYDLIGMPRLVRLNPNVPWKTRGNAAICISLGKGSGNKMLIGGIGGHPVHSYLAGSSIDNHDILERATDIVGNNAHLSCQMTNPGVVVSTRAPSRELYWRTVREIVPLKDSVGEISAVGGKYKKFKNGRGVIGAAAAMAWRPRDFTFELLTYRMPDRIGTKRNIDGESVGRMDQKLQKTFHNIDDESGHVAIAPASPCPILFGVRGDSIHELIKARQLIKSEHYNRWLVFLTNQATDDHIVTRRISDVQPRQGVRVVGTVSKKANWIAGGHTFFEIEDGSGSIACAVYEPSGSMTKTAQRLIEGDRLAVFGSVRPTPFEINVEKFQIIKAAPCTKKIENPVCPKCGKHMKSIGRNAGFRCIKCGAKARVSAAKSIKVERPKASWYEPPVASRRHLYKPLSRYGIKRRPLREILYRYASD